jgi:AraC-like DNA-binding protein
MVQFSDKKCCGGYMKVVLSCFGDDVRFISRYMLGAKKLNSHVHQFIQFCFVMDGVANVSVEGEKRILTAGDFAVIHPFREHIVESFEGCVMWTGVISDKMLNGFGSQLAEYVWGEDFVFRGSDSLVEYVKNHLPPEHYISSPIGEDAALLYNIHALFNAIMEEYANKIPVSAKPNYNSALGRIYEYVENHFKEDITINDVAQELGYSPKYISHMLSLIPNTNFRKMLNSRRVLNAKWWLLNSDKTVLEIALQAGFAQERTFYRAFKYETNMTPSEFCKKYKR